MSKVSGQWINLFQIEIEKQIQELDEIQKRAQANEKIVSDVQMEKDEQNKYIENEAIAKIKRIQKMLESTQSRAENQVVWKVLQPEETMNFDD